MLDILEVREEITRGGLIRDDVYNRIRSDILACRLVPGCVLQEKNLAARYGVSKSPVRDSLLRLQEQGLIAVIPRKGYKVQPISLADAKDLYETRILLEKTCIRRAIDCSPDEGLENLDRFRTVEKYQDLTEWVAYNREFHRTLAELSGNARLTKIAHEVIDQFDRLTFMGVSTAPSGASSQKLLREHCNIINAIQARDKVAASRLIDAHVTKSQRRVFSVLENPPIVE